MPNGSTPTPQGTPVQPAPLPWTANVQSIQDDAGRTVVVLNIMTPAGQTFLFMSPNEARALAGNLRKVADDAPRLIVPPPGTQLP